MYFYNFYCDCSGTFKKVTALFIVYTNNNNLYGSFNSQPSFFSKTNTFQNKNILRKMCKIMNIQEKTEERQKKYIIFLYTACAVFMKKPVLGKKQQQRR